MACEVANKNSRKRVSEADIIDALETNKGILTAASAWLAENKGIKLSRQGIAARIEKSKRLQDVRAEVDETTLDFVESKLLELLVKGDKTAIIFYLKCKGKHRGYVERSEITGKDGAPAQMTLLDIMGSAKEIIKNHEARQQDNGYSELDEDER